MIIHSRQSLSRDKISDFSEIGFWKHFSESAIMFQKPGDHPNFQKNALGVKRPFSELSENSGVFSEKLSEFNVILGMRKSILGMASHEFIEQYETTILGATPGVIPGIDGNPAERFSFAHAFSEYAGSGLPQGHF